MNDDFDSCLENIESREGNDINELSKCMFENTKERMCNLIMNKIKTFIIEPMNGNLIEWLLDGFMKLDNNGIEKLFNFSEEEMNKKLETLEQQLQVCDKNYLNFTSMIKEFEGVNRNTFMNIAQCEE